MPILWQIAARVCSKAAFILDRMSTRAWVWQQRAHRRATGHYTITDVPVSPIGKHARYYSMGIDPEHDGDLHTNANHHPDLAPNGKPADTNKHS